MSKDIIVEASPDAGKPSKRIAFLKARTAARVTKEDQDMVMTFPSLVVKEVVAFEIMVIVLAILSLIVDAPLEWIANPDHTPNPAKAPWYFLGLQELLHYFPPVVAGVILPTLAVIALVVIPYFRVNISREGLRERGGRRRLIALVVVGSLLSLALLLLRVYAMFIPTVVVVGCMLIPAVAQKPTRMVNWLGSRSFSWWIMTWFVLIVVVLTAIGTLFRGPEWSWTWPWQKIY